MKGLIAAVCAGFLLSVSPAWGDATIELSFKTGGIQGMGAAEGTSVQRYQGLKGSDTASTRFTGAILSRLAGGNEAVTITRVDKGVYWNLDPKEHAYQESPIALPKAEKEPARAEKPEKPSVRVVRSEYSVKKTGAAESINGFPCQEYLLTWLLETENLETKERSTSTMTTNLWTTPETATIRGVQAEEQAFHQALAKKMGLELSAEDARQMGMQALAGMGLSEAELKKGLARMKNEMAKVKGYPIRTVVSWTLEGQGGATPAAEEEAPSGGMGSLLGGLFAKMAGPKAEETTSGGKPLFSSTWEVKRISTEAVPGPVFEIPAGYKKK